MAYRTRQNMPHRDYVEKPDVEERTLTDRRPVPRTNWEAELVICALHITLALHVKMRILSKSRMLRDPYGSSESIRIESMRTKSCMFKQ